MATISFQGKPLHTSGELPAVGSKAPDFSLVNSKLMDVNLASFAGKKKHHSPSPDYSVDSEFSDDQEDAEDYRHGEHEQAYKHPQFFFS